MSSGHLFFVAFTTEIGHFGWSERVISYDCEINGVICLIIVTYLDFDNFALYVIAWNCTT